MRQAGSIVGDVVRGAVAGAAAVWVMDRIDWFMYRHEDPASRRRTERARPGGKDPAHVMADVAAGSLGVELARPRDNAAGVAVHYGLGILPAAVYGVLRDRLPVVGAGRGLLYGFGLFLAEDEAANPLLGTAAPPGRYPWQAHARGLVAHLVLGVVTDTVLRVLGPPDRARRATQAPG